MKRHEYEAKMIRMERLERELLELRKECMSSPVFSDMANSLEKQHNQLKSELTREVILKHAKEKLINRCNALKNSRSSKEAMVRLSPIRY